MQNVAQGWLVLQLTNSPLWLGLLGLSFAVPMIVLPLVGGAVVDRIDRIKLLYVTQTGAMLTALILAILTWTGTVHISYILIASFVGSTLLAFDNPARQALLPDLVPKSDLMNAISLNSATYTGAALVGPAIAGALLAPLGAGTLFFLNALSYLAVIFALAAMRNVKPHDSTRQHASLGKSMLAGLSYAWKNRIIAALLGLSALASIFGRSYQNLLPIFARDIWNGGPAGYGILLSVSGAGALVGAFGLAAVRNLKRQGAILVASGIIFSLSLILFALSPYFWPGVILLFISGIAVTVFGTIISTFIQVAVPNELRGRAMSLYSITLIGLPSLGAMGIGGIAEALGGISGAPRAVLIGGIVVAVILLLATPLLWKRNIDTLKPHS
jgi:MFS family permease